MDQPVITSTQNPHIKQLAKLSKRRVRDELGLFIIEGPRPIMRALQQKIEIVELIYYSELLTVDDLETRNVIDSLSQTDIRHTQVSAEVMSKIAYRQHPEGILAVAKQWRPTLSSLSAANNSLFFVLEAVEKPGNIGAILRTADAVGASGVIVCDPATDIYNPNVVRASTGTVFSVPIAIADTRETIAWLREHNIKIVATTPHTDTSYTEADYRGATAFALGTESTGLSDSWLEAADLPVKLPMNGIADSLNVSATAVVLGYEALRQREARHDN